MSNTVYKFSIKGVNSKRAGGGYSDPKAIRLIFLGNGSACVYSGSTLIQSDLLYTKPDSHVESTNESIPTYLFCGEKERIHIETNKIKLPFKIMQEEVPADKLTLF